MIIRTKPTKYAVFERAPRMNPGANQVILGYFTTAEEAESSRKSSGFTDGNYYVAKVAPDNISPLR